MRLLLAAAFAFLLAAAAQAQTSEVPTTDLEFGRAIAMIRADVATGDELVRRRDWRLAYRHFMFPVEEVYGIVRQDLRTYKTPPFDIALRTLARTARAGNAKQYPAALKKVTGALDAAEAGLRARQPNWLLFTVQVTVALLKAASDEYDDAIENGRIVRPISYQMARAFIREADRMIDGVSAASGESPGLEKIRVQLGRLKQAFEPINAPGHPPIDLSEISASVERIETAAKGL